MRHSARHRAGRPAAYGRGTGRHRATTRLGDDLLDAAGSALYELGTIAGDVARRPVGPVVPRRLLIIAGVTALALSFVGIRDPSAALAAPATPETPVVAVAHVVAPEPVRYTSPATAADPVVARDGYGVTILPPPESPDDVSWPVPASTPISSPFGPRVAPCPTCSTDHHGIDLIPGEGTPVAVVSDGTVVEVGGDPAAELGVFVVVRHLIHGQTVESLYGHLQVDSVPVRVGDRIRRGTQIGLVGNTGESTGPHLHFGISSGGQFIDPSAWMAAHVDR